jgi:hypothetical protein
MEEFTLCDQCRVHWSKSVESKQSTKFYRKIYAENLYNVPEYKEQQRIRNAESWLKRKGESSVTIEEEQELEEQAPTTQ